MYTVSCTGHGYDIYDLSANTEKGAKNQASKMFQGGELILFIYGIPTAIKKNGRWEAVS